MIQKQAKKDGVDVSVVFAQDPGQAGKTEFAESAKKLIEKGFVVKADPSPSNKSKLTKFSPFASACENGLVYIDKASFGNQETYEAFCKELESFDGERSTSTRKDDWVDAIASAFNYLCSCKIYKTPKLPDTTSTTRYNHVMSNSAPQFGESLMNKGGHIV